jgi:hypothetical protein
MIHLALSGRFTRFEFWVAELQNGRPPPGTSPLDQIVADFLGSQEFTNHFGPYQQISPQSFIEDLYETALHRHADPGGLQHWQDELAHGTSRVTVAEDILFSSEGEANVQGAFTGGVFLPSEGDAAIARLFYALLDRPPDGGGLQFWENQQAHGLPLQAIAQDFISSSEYQHLHGPQTDQQFVDALYQGALGRPADAGGEAAWVSQLSHGATRADVALGIAESPEAQAHLAPVIENGFRLV